MIKSLLIAAALSSACGAALAGQDYKLWVDIANAPLGVQVGDITIGNSKYTPPAWACGRRIANPDHYAFRGQYGSIVQNAQGVNQAGDLNGDVHLWMNRCGKSVSVERVVGGEIATPIGTHFAEIDGASGSYWVDGNGDNHHCGAACVAPVGFKTLTMAPDWHAATLVLDAALEGVLGGSAGAPKARLRLDDAMQRIQALQQRTTQAVVERRRINFSSLEMPVRAAEDIALAALGQAVSLQDQCRRHWLALRPADGAVACSAAQDALRTAQATLKTVIDEVR